MYRKEQFPTWINILFDNGGIGDAIARLPAVKFIHDNHPHVRIYLWVPDFFYDFTKASLKDCNRILISRWSEGATKFKSGFPGKQFRSITVTNLGMHMTEHAFIILCNTQPTDTNSYNYLQPDLSKIDIDKFSLPEKYVVVSTGYTAKVRQFLPEYINKIVTYIKLKGYEVVFLGKKEIETGLQYKIQGDFNSSINYSAGIDLIDKTSLFEATKVCSKSKAVVGLDNGILHLAGCTNVPIIGGFTSVNPIHRMPYRNGKLGWEYYPVVPPESLDCRFCQSNWQFTFNHEFVNCFYQDTKCVKELDAELYIKELEKVL
jgi:ADP-heptose:LPS heptosyltransferase